MKRLAKFQKFLWGFGTFIICSALYLSLAFLMLGTENKAADGGAESVPYEKSYKDFSVLLASDELSQYCALMVYPSQRRAVAVLFSTREAAEAYESRYSRRVEYQKKTEIDIVGRIGGIVINTNISYNDDNSMQSGNGQTERIFGSRVLELAADKRNRLLIAGSILGQLFSTTLDQTDFNFIFSSCETDISYIDFCEYYPLLKEVKDNIYVTLG